jgi:hypothetical protein
MTRTHAIRAVQFYLLYQAHLHGETLSEDLAERMAEALVDTFGHTGGFTTGEILAPIMASPGVMLDWPKIRGWRVKGQRRRLALHDLVIRPRERARASKLKAHIAAVVDAKRALRHAKMALADRPEAPERQREAFRLVRIEGLTYRDAGLKLGVSGTSVFNLVRRFEKGLTNGPESAA